MADSDAYVAGPKGDNGNATAGATEIVTDGDGKAERVLLGEFCGDAKDFVFAPSEAGAEEGGQVMRSGVRIGKGSVEEMLLERDGVELDFV